MSDSSTIAKDKPFVSFLKKHHVWILFAIASVLLTGLVFLITSSHLYLLFLRFLDKPALFLFNIFPVLLFMLLCYFISGRVIFSVSLSTAVFLALAFVDQKKITLRQEPLLPSDLTLAKEVLAIVKNFPKSQLVLVILGLLAFLVLLAIAFYFSKNAKPLWKVRLFGALAILVVGYGANALWYTSTALYESYPVMGNPYFQVNQYNSKGLIYSFCHQFNITRVSSPEGYSNAEIEKLEQASLTMEVKNKPHIVMIMGEAFSDLSNNPNLDFTDYRDPLKNFKEMSTSQNGVSGKIVVPGFGGGTSNTEYDVLTACSTRYLNNPLPSYNFVHQPFDALPRRLQQLGYDTQAIHPGFQWFYNRKNVYPDLGFETTYFLEDSFDLEQQGLGGYVNETATMDKIIDTLDDHIKNEDTPLFSFTVTIQNHGPYDNHYGPLPDNFKTDISLTDGEKDLLTQYFKGIIDADTQLGRLKEYAQESAEPIVLVYFGDHLPGFSNGMEFFDLLDYPIDPDGSLEERLALYETPYLIWQNDAAKEQNSIQEAAKKADLPQSGIISAHYLGGLLTELLGMDGISPLYNYVNESRHTLPAGTNNIFVDAQGDYSDTPNDEQLDIIQIMRKWQYYKLFDQIIAK